MKPNLTEIEREVLADYDQLVIGNLRNIDPYYFADKSRETNQSLALLVIQYAIEKYIKWSPQKMYASITMDIMHQWHLATILRYVDFPADMNKEKYTSYLAHMIYPDIIQCTEADICLAVYRRALDGANKKVPKDFFRGAHAMDYLCYCLRYVIDNFTNFKTLEEAYEFFGTTKCMKFLRTYKLGSCIKEQFEAPIVPFYLLCAHDQQIPILFHYYRFWSVFEEVEREQESIRALREQQNSEVQHVD